MPISRYAVLGITIEDARTHPAYSGACAVMTPLSVNEGWIVSGYVMTDAFWEECTRDDARGDAARVTLDAAKRAVIKATPPRTVRPATIAEIPVPFPGSL